MKHASTREVYAHWNERRNNRLAPERDDIEPGAIRGALGDTFILAFDPLRGHPFRIAGTRVCALFCRELKGASFEVLWSNEARADIRDLVSIAAEEGTGTVAAVSARARGIQISLELLLLPIYRSRWNEVRVLGVMAPMSVPAWLGASSLSDLTLGSLRHLGPLVSTPDPEPPSAPRVHLRHGFVVYEGGRSAP